MNNFYISLEVPYDELIYSRNLAKSVNGTDGHQVADITNNRKLSVLKISNESRLLGIGKLSNRKARIFHLLRG